jgi:ABC-type cobalamin/Fe3+-siderophores transport system ATPase subunit
MRPNIIMPNRTGAGASEALPGESNVVLVGANGAGKTRLGIWLDFNQGHIRVHRISAQRALAIPQSATMQTLAIAEKLLWVGEKDAPLGQEQWNKTHYRYGNDIIGNVLSDYQHLLSTLFAKKTKRDADYVAAVQNNAGGAIALPSTPIDTITEVWQDIMPHNQIKFDDGQVLVSIVQGEQIYHAKEMSDGERVSLYLLGQCLCAPENSLLIIDEPEIHLHKSLMSRLWNKIEDLCPDKVLVYITHDLDFAASRKTAKKIWVKQFVNAGSWLWDEVPEVEEIPENLAIEIIGSRKNILFSEGDKSSYDYILYQAAYPDYHVMPRGSCNKVIESTRAINNNPNIHHLTASGIIDADYRPEEEIQALAAHRVFTISVAEVENLFCIEPLLRLVAQNQHLPNIDETVAQVRQFIIDALADEFETQVANHAEKEIRFKLNAYTKTAPTEAGLTEGMNNLLQTIDISLIYQASHQIFQAAIDSNDLHNILRVYNRKKLSERVSPFFNLANREYVNILLRMLNTNRRQEIIQAIMPYLPNL